MLRSAFLIHLITVVTFLSCSNSPKEADQTAGTYKTVSSTEFQSLEKKVPNLVLIDVRTPAEFQASKIKGAMNINVSASDFESQIEKLDKAKPVALYCASGRRSAHAMDIMRQKGFTTIYNLDGGIKAWAAAGLPVE